MSISFSGLASGLDTSSWITSLTQLRQAKVTTLEAQKANVVSAQSTLQSIRSFFSTFRSTIEKITDSKFNSTVSNIFAKKTALSSNLAAVTATVKSGAAEGTYEVSVKQTATQTQAKSGYRYTTTLISTTQAKTSSSLSNVGVGYGVNEGSGIKSGEVDIRHDGVTTQIFISSDETMESFLDKLHNEAHVEAEFDNQTGIFSIGVSAEDIIDVGNTGILSKLKISSINYGYTGSQLSIEESHDEYEQATRDTLLSALGVRAGHLTINTAVDVYDVELGNDDTIGSLVDALREEGIEAAFSDGVFSINNAYISNDGDTHLIEAFGLTTPDVARQTQETGGLKFQTIWTETTTASGTTLLCNIDGVSLDGEKTINVKNASGVISTITVDTETTINDLVAAFNDEDVGLTAAFDPETGRLSISDGWIVSGGTFEDIESAFGLVYTPVAQTETGSRLTVTTMTVTGATGGTTLKDLTTEVTSGNIDVTDNMGVVHHVTINQNSTINDFVTQVRGLGLGAEFNDATGVLTLTGGSYAAVYNEDDEIAASNILSVFFNSDSLEATSVNSSAASSAALRVEITSTQTATGTVTMSQLGLADGTYEATFRTGSTDIVATITQNTTLSEFESDLRSKGLDITFNAGTGKFTIEDGEYLGVNTGTFGEIMDFSSVITGRYATSSEVLAQTVTIGNELTSAGIVYHTISYITTISTTTYDTVVMTSTGGPVTYQTTATTQTAATAGVDITGDSLTYGSVTTTAAGQTSGVLSYVVIGTTEGQTVTIGSEMTSSQLDALVSIGVVQTSDLLSYQTIIDNAGTYVTLGLSITGEEFGELFSVIQPITSEELCSGSERIMAYSKQLTLLNDSAVEIKGADSSYSNTNNSITIKQILTDYADSTVVVSGTLRAHDGWEYYFDNETVATVIGVLTEQGILEGYSDGIYSTTTGDGYYDKGISYVDGTLASTLFHTYLNLEGGSFGKGESWDYVDDFIDEGIVNSVTATGAGTERAARLDALVSSITQNATATTVGDAILSIDALAYDGTGQYTDYVYVTSAADFTAILKAVEHAGAQHAIADLSIILDFSGSVVYDTKNFKNIAEKYLHCTIVATSTSNVTIDAINTSSDKSALFGDLGASCVAGITFNFNNNDQISGLVKNKVTDSSLSDIAIVNFHGDHLFGDIFNSAIDSMSVLYSRANGYFIGDIESSSISNMYVESSVAFGEKSGFIHEVSKSAISNLQFNNFHVFGHNDAAIFGGILDSEISSVYVNNSEVTVSLANDGQASGFAHLVEGSSLSDIKLDMVVTSDGRAYGFARSIGSSTIREAVTRGYVQANKEACGFVHEIASANISDSEIYMDVESFSAIAFAFYADALSDKSAFTGNIVRNCVGGGSCAALISKGDEYCTYQNNNFDMLINANRGNYSYESTVLYSSNRDTRENSIMIRRSNQNIEWTNYEGNGYYIGSTNRFVSDNTPLRNINIATYKPGVNPRARGQIFADNNIVSIGPSQTLSDIADALANIGVTLSSDGNTHTNHIDNTVLTSLTDIGSILHGYFNLAPGDTSSITSVQRAGTYIGPVTRVADLIGGTSYIKFREGSGIETFSITESTTLEEMQRALSDRGVEVSYNSNNGIIVMEISCDNNIIDEFGDNLMSIFPNGIYMTDPGTSWEGITNGASTTFGEMGIVDYMPSYFILNDGTHVTVNSSDTITDVIAKLGTCGVTATFDHNMISFGYHNDTAAIADMTYDLASILFHIDSAQWQQSKSNILGEGVTYTTSVNSDTTISQLNPLIGATDFVTIHTNTTVIEGKGGNPIRDIIDALADAGITASIKDNRFVIESGSNYITSIDAPLAEALNISSDNNVFYTSFQIQSGDVLTTYGISTSSSSDVQIQSVVSDGAETIITYLQPDEVKNSFYNETTYITHTVTTTVAATFSEGGTQATGVMHFEEVQTTGGLTVLTANTMQQTSNVLMSNGVTATAGTTLSALDQWIGEGDIIYSDGTTMATSPFLGNTAFNITDAADVADAIENNDYIGIGSAEALEAFAIAVNNGTDCSGKTIYLTSDINLSGYDDWVGIGDSDTAFSGIFDGQGHTISNLTIDSSDGYKGLFGKVSGTIQNLKIEDVDIHTDGRYVGAIAGVLEGTLLNCYAINGSVESDYAYSSAGGLVGLLNGAIDNSWSDLYVNGQQYVGGLVGEGMGTITNSYTTGDVQGESKAGGLIGQLDGNTSLNNVYAGGNVDASGSNSGRLIGYKGGTSLYAVDVTVKKGINDGVQMIGDTVSFDSLVSESSANSIKTTFLDNMINVIDGAFMAEAIANSNQIGIGSADALYALATIVNSGTNCKDKTFYLTSDIDLSDYADWVGIGDSSHNFVGTFDGQGYVISNLTITSSGNYKGLFGKLGGSTNIKNVGIENVNIEASGNYVGALVGSGFTSTVVIENCYVSGGTVKSTATISYVGGLMGASYGCLGDCWSDVSVEGKSGAGGLIGLASGTITNCYTSGNVSGTSNVGGLIGQLNSTTTLDNVYAGGNVSASGSKKGRLMGSANNKTLNVTGAYVQSDINTTLQMIGNTTNYDASISEIETNTVEAGYTGTYKINVINGADMADAIASSNQIGIGSAEALYALATIINSGTNCAGKTFYLTSDIDLSDYADWVGIGTSGHSFTGTFDGQGHVISNLTITSSGSNKGLFGYTKNSATIKNVGIENVNIEISGAYAGALVGYNAGSKIYNCYASGGTIKSTATDSYAGGLCGRCTAGTIIDDCWSDVTVDGKQYVGGLVGQMCGTIKDSYTSGDVSGTSNVGGLIGQLYGITTLDNVYAGGNVSASDSNKGRLMGSANNKTLNVTGAYVQSDINTTLQMIGNTNSYDASISAVTSNPFDEPELIGNKTFNVINGVDMWDAVLNNDYIGIGSAEALNALATIINYGINTTGKTFVLTNDIDLSDYTNWQRIGNGQTGIDESGSYFRGVFDGQGHTISNLTISDVSDEFAGLFGRITNAGTIVRNVGLTNVNVSANCNSVGALVGGAFNGAAISNCYVSGGTVTSSGSYTGGIIGRMTGLVVISDTFADVTVSGVNSVGGIAGACIGTIRNSYAIGSASGTHVVGGLVGYTQQSESITLENVYSGVTVTCAGTAGRLLGELSNASITDAYVESGINAGMQKVGNTTNYDSYISEVDRNLLVSNIYNQFTIHVNGTDTVSDLMTKLNTAGYTTSLDNGVITAREMGSSFVLSMSDNLSDLLGINTGAGYSYDTNIEGGTVLISTDIASGDDLLKDYGCIGNVTIVTNNGTITHAECSSIDSLISKLASKGIGASINNGILSIGTNSDTGYITSMSANFANAFGFSAGEGITYYVDDVPRYDISGYSLDTTMSAIGLTENGVIEHSEGFITINTTDTLETALSKLDQSGLVVDYDANTGRLNLLDDSSGIYLKDMSHDLANVLGGIIFGLGSTYNTTGNSTTVAATENTKLTDIGILTGDTIEVQNQTTASYTVNSDSTLGDIMSFMNSHGMSVSLSEDGRFKINSGSDGHIVVANDRIKDALGLGSDFDYIQGSRITGDTELGELGLATGQTIETNSHTYTFQSTATLNDIREALISDGIYFDVDEDRGRVHISSNSGANYVKSMSSGLQNALNLEIGEGASYSVNVTAQYTTNTVTASLGDTLGTLSLTADGTITVQELDGTFTVVSISTSDTVQTLLDKLDTVGVTATFANGVVTLGNASDESVITNMSSTLKSFLNIDSGLGSSYTTLSMDVTEDTQLSILGITGADTGVITTESDRYTFGSSDTIGDIISALETNGINVDITDGVITFSPTEGHYIKSISSNLELALHVEAGYDESYGVNYTPPSSTTTTIAATGSTTMSSLGMSTSGTIYTNNGTVTIQSTDTVQDVIDKLGTAGVSAYYNNVTGEFTIGARSPIETVITSGTDMAAAIANCDHIGIASAEALYALATITNAQTSITAGKTFYLTEDIDLSGYNNWVGIGCVNRFNGTFDGQGHVVSNLKITSGGDRGLFGVTDGATIKNVGVEDVNISTSGNYVGALVGSAYTTSIENCYVSGGTISSTATNNYFGGLVGRNDGGTITNSWTDVTVNGDQNVGGLVGSNDKGKITNCYALGNVSGRNNVGGLVGSDSRGKISNAYTEGTVTASGNYGGRIIGFAYANIIASDVYAKSGTNAGMQYIGNTTSYDSNFSEVANNPFQNTGFMSSTAPTLIEDDTNYVIGMSQNMTSALGNISTGQGFTYNIEQSDNDAETSTTMSQLGMSSGTAYIRLNTDTVTVTSTSTIQDIIDGLGSVGITATLNEDSQLVINAGDGVYVESISASLANALQIEAGNNISYRITPEIIGTTSTIADSNTTLSTLGMSSSGKIFTNGVTVTIQSTDTIQDVIDKLETEAGVSAYYNNVTGEFTLGAHSQIETVITSGTDMAAAIANCDHIGIASAEALYALATITNAQTSITAGKTFYLTEDIDLSDYSNWVGIGHYSDSTKRFQGTFDGQGHVVSNLKITSGSSKGLFGDTSRATIKNVGVEDVNISTSGNYVGALVGNSKYTSIENCYVSGGTISSTATNNYFGGLVGCNDGGTITNSWTDVTVNGDQNVGGLVGTTTGGSITNCYALGNVSGTNYIGGLVGRLGSGFTISNAYTEGTITASGSNVGRIIGLANMIIASDVYAKTGTNAGMRYIGNTTSYDSNFSEAASNPFQNPGFIATVMPPAMVEANDTNYVTGMSQNLTAALGNISTGQGFTYNITSNTEVEEDTAYSISAITTEKTFEGIGITSTGGVLNLSNGETVTVKNDTTVASFITDMGNKGFDVTLTNGIFNIQAQNGTDYIVDCTDENVLAAMNIVGSTYSTNTLNLGSTKLKDLKNSLGENLGITTGNIKVYKNGLENTINISNETTLDQLASILADYNIQMVYGLGSSDTIRFNSYPSGNSYMEEVGGGTNLLTQLGITSWGTYKDSESKGLEYRTSSDVIVDTNTKLVNLKRTDGTSVGITEGDYKIVANGMNYIGTVDATTSISDFFTDLARYGITGTLNSNGQINLSSTQANTYLVAAEGADGYSNIVDTLFPSWSYGNVYVSNSMDVTNTSTSNMTATTRLKDIDQGTYQAGKFVVSRNGVNATVTLSENATVEDFMSAIRPYGFTSYINNGQVVVENDGVATLTDYETPSERTNVVSLLGLDPSTWEQPGYYTGSERTTTNYHTELRAATRDTKLSDLRDAEGDSLGITTGEYYVYSNGIRHTLNIDSTDITIENFTNALSTYGINAIYENNGRQTTLKISANGNSYVETSTALTDTTNIVDVLFHNSKATLYSYEGYEQTTTNVTTTAIASLATSVSDYNQGTSLSEGTLALYVDGNYREIEVTSYETFGSLLEKFERAGVTASLNDGVMRLETGNTSFSIDTENSTSNLITNLGLSYNDNLGGFAASTGAVTQTTTTVESRTLSVAKYADYDTQMSLLNISSGTVSIYKNGMKRSITIDNTENFSDFRAKIQTAFEGDIDIDFRNGKLRFFSTEEGVDVQVGSSNDTSNISSICGFIQNENGDIISSRELYKVNASSKITTEGLFRKGDVTTGTFVIGDETFTITENTTIQNIVAQINSSDKSNASAYWDSVDGKLIISSRTTGASIINIEAGTSNFTDILGLTQSEWDEGALERTKILTDSQTIGNNASFSINGTNFSSSSNVITSDVSRIQGLTLNLKSATPGQVVTVSITQDTEAVTDAVGEFVDAYNELIENVDNELATSGALKDQSTLKFIKQQIRNLIVNTFSGSMVFKNLAALGISTTNANAAAISTANVEYLYFDPEKFLEGYNKDPEAVKNMLVGSDETPGILLQIENIVENALATGTGYFSTADKSYSQKISGLNEKIKKANAAIEAYRARLETKFQSMDLLISQMQNQYNSFMNSTYSSSTLTY